jgi:hypothetical protein
MTSICRKPRSIKSTQAELAEFNVIPEIPEISERDELNAEYVPSTKNGANKWTALATAVVAMTYFYVLAKKHLPHFLD